MSAPAPFLAFFVAANSAGQAYCSASLICRSFFSQSYRSAITTFAGSCCRGGAKGPRAPYNEVCFWSLILPHASGNRRVANPTISIWMKRRATFIVLKPHLRRMAGLLLKDGQTPLTSGKPSSMFTSPKMPSARFAPQSVAQRRLARIAAAFRMRTATMWPRVLEVLPAIMEIAREVSGFAADQSGEVRLGAAFS